MFLEKLLILGLGHGIYKSGVPFSDRKWEINYQQNINGTKKPVKERQMAKVGKF